MERKFINRFYSYCNCLKDFSEAKYRDITDSFVLSGTVNKFSLTFDLSWKVMKDILVQYYGVSDFAAGSPRETLRSAYKVDLIFDDTWMEMLKIRNELTHDYDAKLARKYVRRIIDEFIDLFWQFKDKVDVLLSDMEERIE